MERALPSNVGPMGAIRTSAEVESLLVELRPWLYRLALAIVGTPDLAEDAAQEALLRASRNRGKLARVDDPRAWLRRVVVRCAIDAMGSRKETGIVVEGARSGTLEKDVAVRDALSRLEPNDRAMLVLAHFEGLSYAEISRALGIPVGTVGSRLSSAREAFRRRWGDG